MCIHLLTDINQESGGSTMVSVASSCGRTALLNSSHLNETIRARQRAGPGYDSNERTWSVIIASCCVLVSRLKAPSGKSCGNVSVANSRTLVVLSLSYPETGNIQRAEEYSADSLISPDSSLFVVHRAENGSLVDFARDLRCPRSPTRSRVWSNGP